MNTVRPVPAAGKSNRFHCTSATVDIMHPLQRSTMMIQVVHLLFIVSTVATSIPIRIGAPAFRRRISLSQNSFSRRSRSPSKPSILSIRGGSDYDDEEEDYDEDDDFELDDGDFDVAEDDFAEEKLVDRMIIDWQKSPPFTKAYIQASFGATMVGYLFNKNHFPKLLQLEWGAVLKKMQIWRLLTAFLNVGPFGLGSALSLHFAWTYMSTLERLHHDRPYDFWIMILFGCMSMVTGYAILKMPPKFLGHNLSTFLVYVWSRYHEGLDVNFFELFNAKAELLPWIFLGQTFLLEGEPPILDFLGIVFGHVYHHCKTVGMLRAPQFLVDWYNSDNPFSTKIRNKYKEISSDFVLQ